MTTESGAPPCIKSTISGKFCKVSVTPLAGLNCHITELRLAIPVVVLVPLIFSFKPLGTLPAGSSTCDETENYTKRNQGFG